MDYDEMTSDVPDYLRSGKNAHGGQPVKALAEEVFREFVQQKINDEIALYQLILNTAAKGCHTLYGEQHPGKKTTLR